MAKEVDAVILSLDSLAIYRKIDIASAKPSPKERGGIIHFGIDEICPDEEFNVALFINLYQKAQEYATIHNKNLLILGGTGFYLSALVDGVSKMPAISQNARDKATKEIENIEEAYNKHLEIDPHSKIAKNDRYRLQKWYEFWFETGVAKEQYFQNNPPIPVIEKPIEIYEIEVEKEVLNERIRKRTTQMFEDGLVEEVQSLISEYGKDLQPFKAIGIKEVIEYLQGQHSLEKTKELVYLHTRQLAKRQRTYNRSKFEGRISAKLSELKEPLLNAFKS